ncbi:MAG TPA: HAD hydrolase family protein, partial [Clostridia bacterium]
MTNLQNLYISDLDGTLLNSSKEVSKYSKDIINALIKDGMKFSVATARTSGTVVKILSELNINVPLVLMNGVAIY